MPHYIIGEGEAIVCWEDKREDGLTYGIYTMKISGEEELIKEWEPETGVPVVTAEQGQDQIRLCPDGVEGAYFTWEDARENDFWNADIWAQRLNSDGDPVWDENGIAVCRAGNWQHAPIVLLSDRSCTIAWNDTRNGGHGVYAQQLSPEGRRFWDENGEVVVEGIDGNAQQLKILPRFDGSFTHVWLDGRRGELGAFPYIQYCRDAGNHIETLLANDGIPVLSGVIGGASYIDACNGEDGVTFVVWEDHRRGQPYSIYAQCVSAEGELIWDEGGLLISEENPQYEKGNPKVCIDGEGGIYVAWESDTGNRYAEDLILQHVNRDGELLWDENGKLITNMFRSYRGPSLINDGEDGVVVVWEAFAISDSCSDICAARISSDGESRWNDDNNFLTICDAPHRQEDAQLIRHQNGYVIVWTDDRNEVDEPQKDIFGQFINPDGSFRWRENGAAICDFEYNQDSPVIAIDNETHIWVAWVDHRWYLSPRRLDIYIQKVSSRPTDRSLLESLLGERHGVLVCGERGNQISPQLVHDGHNGMWVVWEDCRSGQYSYIYATHLNSDGEPLEGWDDNGQVVCDAYHRQQYPKAALLRRYGDTGIAVAWNDKRATYYSELFNIYTQRLDDDVVPVSQQNREPLPTGYSLDEAYPNPFNSQTNIQYQLTVPDHVVITILDIEGRELKRLVDGRIEAGYHRTIWDASDMPSGLYFCRFEAQGFAKSIKLVLLK